MGVVSIDVWLGLFVALFLGMITARVIIVYHRTGVFPIVPYSGNATHDYIVHAVIPMQGVLQAISILSKLVLPVSLYAYLVPIPYLERQPLEVAGLVLAYISLAWLAIAQAQMGASWRIGNDTKHETELVTHGLYRLSRHPIYLGFMGISAGLFFAVPNALSLVSCALTIVIFNVEARLEEDFQAARHGEAYQAYLARRRRWL